MCKVTSAWLAKPWKMKATAWASKHPTMPDMKGTSMCHQGRPEKSTTTRDNASSAAHRRGRSGGCPPCRPWPRHRLAQADGHVLHRVVVVDLRGRPSRRPPGRTGCACPGGRACGRGSRCRWPRALPVPSRQHAARISSLVSALDLRRAVHKVAFSAWIIASFSSGAPTVSRRPQRMHAGDVLTNTPRDFMPSNARFNRRMLAPLGKPVTPGSMAQCRLQAGHTGPQQRR